MEEEKQAPDIRDVNNVPISTLESWSGYWRSLVNRKRRLHDVSVQQIILGQVFTLFTTIGAGYFVSLNTESLLLIGTSLLLYPVIAETLSSNAAVMVSGLHHQLDNIEESSFVLALKALIHAIFIGLCACLFLGVVGGIIGMFLFDARFINTISLAALSGIFTGVIGLPIMASVLFVSRRLQVNPDNVAPPVETAVFNTLAIVSIVIVSGIIA